MMVLTFVLIAVLAVSATAGSFTGWVIGTPNESCNKACGSRTCNAAGIRAINSVAKMQDVAFSLSIVCSGSPSSSTDVFHPSVTAGPNGICTYNSAATSTCDSSVSQGTRRICCCGSIDDCSTGLPSANPSAKPSNKPSAKPSTKPSAKPSTKPSAKPSTKPSAKPSTKPRDKPSTKPSAKPSTKPRDKPSTKPSAKPSVKQNKPSSQPSIKPSAKPSAIPVPIGPQSGWLRGDPDQSCNAVCQGINSPGPCNAPGMQAINTAAEMQYVASLVSITCASTSGSTGTENPTITPGENAVCTYNTDASSVCDATVPPPRMGRRRVCCCGTVCPTAPGPVNTDKPSSQPSRKPSSKPTRRDAVINPEPSRKPSSKPSRKPSSRPSVKPSRNPRCIRRDGSFIGFIIWLLCILFGWFR